jgi:hypothetical protein
VGTIKLSLPAKGNSVGNSPWRGFVSMNVAREYFMALEYFSPDHSTHEFLGWLLLASVFAILVAKGAH